VSSTDLAYLSNNLIYSAMAVYALSMLAYGLEVASGVKSTTTRANGGVLLADRSTRLAGIAYALTTLAFVLHLGGVLARGLAAGRVPWGNMYEFSITGAVAVTGVYLALYRRFDLRWLGIVIAPVVLIALGTAVTLLYRPTAPLVPALQSTWLVIHVSAAIISGGVFLVSNAVAGAYLVLDRYEERGGRPEWAQRIPSLDALDQLAYRLIAFVFPLWTFSIIAGAIWAEAAWGRYWGWDPKETWAFITWIAYAAYLHARVTAGWRGKRAAWLSLLAGSTFLFNYVWVNVWGSGKHSYSGL
jgi:cytochrome c-type biogenesis protein CcsB